MGFVLWLDIISSEFHKPEPLELYRRSLQTKCGSVEDASRTPDTIPDSTREIRCYSRRFLHNDDCRRLQIHEEPYSNTLLLSQKRMMSIQNSLRHYVVTRRHCDSDA